MKRNESFNSFVFDLAFTEFNFGVCTTTLQRVNRFELERIPIQNHAVNRKWNLLREFRW